jgi:hypothetical protein
VKGAINKTQLLAGICFLAAGTFYYYFFRGADQTYFLQFLGLTSQAIETSPLLQKLGYSLPTFIHVFAFSLLTAGLIAESKRGYAAACFFWFAVNVLFEFGQRFDNYVVQVIPGWFAEIPFLQNTSGYFLKGRFDYLDLFSITLGALTAYFFLLKTSNKENKNEKQTRNCR